MEDRTFSTVFGVIVICCFGVGLLFPAKLSNIGFMWLVAPWILMGWCFTAYMSAMIYNKSYRIIWPGGSSTTAHGGVELTFPPRDEVPKMGAIPLGGGNYKGILMRGGGKKGWLFAPRELLDLVDKQGQSHAGPVKYEEPENVLPPYILSQLKKHPLYHPQGQIVWALTSIHDPEFKASGGMSAANLLEQHALDQKEINDLNDKKTELLDQMELEVKMMRAKRLSAEYSEREKPFDRVKESMGAE